MVAPFLLYYTAIQLDRIVPAPLSIYSRYSAYTADTVYSDAAYTLYSAIHSPSGPAIVNLVFVRVTELRCVVEATALNR